MDDLQVEDLNDWASASEAFDILNADIGNRDLSQSNEAQTRYDVIDGMIRNVLGWMPGQVSVEEHTDQNGYVDYILSVADSKIIIEAKKIGASFPSPTKKTRLKISGSVLGTGEVNKAINQAEDYAINKHADVVCVTNGLCWCFFSTHSKDVDSYATLLFPFNMEGHAAQLFEVLSETRVREGSLSKILNYEPIVENRLISVLHDADGRLNRNNIADHIVPALNNALYASALTSNVDALEKCFVTTDGRAKFDSLLGMHLADPKPTLVKPATRIKRGRSKGPLDEMVAGLTNYAPPVTLIIGPVGAGKSTYLKHFELVSGKAVLEKRKAHWIYIDFEEMGQEGDPRHFLYSKLKSYLMSDDSNVDFQSLIKPSYKDVIDGLARGPLALIANNKEEFEKRITDIIQRDYDDVEPYVDRLFAYLVKKELCVIVLDNVDLYDDELLETKVFAEGLALSKRLLCNVIVSLRDHTYVNHRNSAAFNAYELKKLWLDPPPFREVLANRLTYSRKILQGKSAKIAMENGIKLDVPDLGAFFEIVQRSVLQGTAGNYIENISDLNNRQGLTLINNFLTSGHIQADRALRSYMTEEGSGYFFPFHEVFKGTALGQWKHYKESRAECINIYDSRNGSKKTRLLRLALLSYLAEMAQQERTLEVAVKECVELFSSCGASNSDVVNTLMFLHDNRLIRTVSANKLSVNESVVISRSGGYYVKELSHSFVYAEQCMIDTAIEDPEVWQKLSEITQSIESHSTIAERMRLRNQRIKIFMDYLVGLEEDMFERLDVGISARIKIMPEISRDVMADSDNALSKSIRYYSSEQ